MRRQRKNLRPRRSKPKKSAPRQKGEHAVTEIAFHFNIADDERGKLNYACRLLRKAYAQGARVGVLAAPEALEALDAALWTFSQRDFIPHCMAQAP
ncbi:MAG: DNA polymerase III subunit chi, partial [Ottowia sp.]|nr:DNA polymerase III subunit chi [Ottowia sp.]